MRKNWTNVATFALCLAVSLTACAPARAEEKKPVVTISFAGYDALKTNAGSIGKIVDRPALGDMLDAMIALGTQGQGLPGLDKSKPWGATLYFDPSMKFPVVAFLPVKDVEKFTKIMQPMGIQTEKQDSVYELTIPGKPPIYAVQKGAWASISNEKEDLDFASDAPEKSLGDLPSRYLIAVKLSVKNIPEETIDLFASQIIGLASLGGGDVDNLTKQINETKIQLKQLDDVTFGIKIDEKKNSFVLDIDVKAKAGTDAAKTIALTKPGKTAFSGLLLPEATATLNWVGEITPEQAEKAKKQLDEAKEQAVKQLKESEELGSHEKLASELLGDLFDIIKDVFDSKKSDGGFALMLDESTLAGVGGIGGIDGAKLEKLVTRIVDLAKIGDEEIVKEFKLKAETYEGFTIHHVGITLPEEEMTPFVGPQLDLYFGIDGKKQCYFSFGKEASAKLKAAIDKSKKDGPKEILPSQLQVSITKVLKFAGAVNEDEMDKKVIGAISKVLASTGGKDHVLLTSNCVNGGLLVHIEVEEGVIKAIGAMSQIQQGGMAEEDE